MLHNSVARCCSLLLNFAQIIVAPHNRRRRDMGISKNTKNLKGAMQNLAQEAPKGKAALIEWMWPEISEGIRNGHRLKAIWERLCANGLQMKHNEFRTYVSRMKKKLAAPQESKEREPVPAPRPGGDRVQGSLAMA